VTERLRDYEASYGQIPGWLALEDFKILSRLLKRDGPPGDLLEVGAYMGASAILLGFFQRPGETFTVCDLFGGSLGEANAAEVAREYPHLTRSAFERNYLQWHNNLPIIVQEPSSNLPKWVKPASCRLVHVDGSHLYEHVVADIDTARAVAQAQSVVVFDDWRSKHTPGVTVGVMERIVRDELHLIAITESKLYAAWDSSDATMLRADIAAWADETASLTLDLQRVRDVDLPRVGIIAPSTSRRRRLGLRLADLVGGT
jgi:hypothetical protein